MISKTGFLHFSQKADVALLLMAEIVAHSDDDSTVAEMAAKGGKVIKPISLKEVAVRTGVSFYFLQKVALDLRKAGLIAAVRGKSGGYVISVKGGAEKISVKNILEAIEGPVAVVSCVAFNQGARCSRSKLCKVREGMNRLNKLIADSLEGVTLEQFVKS